MLKYFTIYPLRGVVGVLREDNFFGGQISNFHSYRERLAFNLSQRKKGGKRSVASFLGFQFG